MGGFCSGKEPFREGEPALWVAGQEGSCEVKSLLHRVSGCSQIRGNLGHPRLVPPAHPLLWTPAEKVRPDLRECASQAAHLFCNGLLTFGDPPKASSTQEFSPEPHPSMYLRTGPNFLPSSPPTTPSLTLSLTPF